MKRKLLLYGVVAVPSSVAIYLVFLVFDLMSGTPGADEANSMKFALSIGVLTSVYMVFFTMFFEKKKET